MLRAEIVPIYSSSSFCMCDKSPCMPGHHNTCWCLISFLTRLLWGSMITVWNRYVLVTLYDQFETPTLYICYRVIRWEMSNNSACIVLTRQIWGIWKLRLAYSPETPNLGQNRWCFVPCDLEIWRMTLENNRASLLCCFKLCATFHSHWWIQTGVTVRKRPIWVKFDDI